MKKFKLFALVGAFAMLFSACSKDDISIVGKWNIDKMTFEMTMVVDGETQTETGAETNQGWIEFKSGGTGIDDAGDSFTWTLSGDKLTISEDGEDPLTMTLTTLTEDKIVGEWTDQEVWQGVDVTTDITIELTKL
ncbi:MAG: lipocalin family protein [Perlabentimonas sp.]